MLSRLSRAFVVGMAVAMLSSSVHAAEPADADSDGILTLQFENDSFGNSDGHFTHGMRAAWLSGDNEVPDWAHAAASYIPLFAEGASTRIDYSLTQSIFTPENISTPEVIPDDRPYAGWLSLGIGLVSVSDTRLDNLQLDVGIVGPHSFAEEVQTRWHRAFDFPHPAGWSHQLKDEPALMLTYARTWRRWATFPFLGLSGDVEPDVSVNLGNVLTQAGAGFTIRIGNDLADHYDYGPPRIQPSLPGSDFFAVRDGFGWYLFAGAEARAVAHNIFLDGNTFSTSYSVDRRVLVGDFQAGLAIFIGRVRLAYTQVFRTKEFVTQDNPDRFGSVSLSVAFKL
jgi:hypothetical protein